jgi:hypothetical protein
VNIKATNFEASTAFLSNNVPAIWMGFPQCREKSLPFGNLCYLNFIVISTRKIIIIVTKFLYLVNKDSAFKVYFMAASFKVTGSFV